MRHLKTAALLAAANLPRFVPSRMSRWVLNQLATTRIHADEWPDAFTVSVNVSGPDVVLKTTEWTRGNSIIPSVENPGAVVLYLLRCAVRGAVPEETVAA